MWMQRGKKGLTNSTMTSRTRFWLLAFCSCCLLQLAAGYPLSGSIFEKYKLGEDTKIPVSELYRSVTLSDIPTTVDNDVILFNRTDLRYGYLVGRPVERLIRNPVMVTLKPLITGLMGGVDELMHWAVVISKKAPNDNPNNLPPSGTEVEQPINGTVFELRHSDNTGLVYLDLKNWSNYVYRLPTVRYLGTLNKTDEEVLFIGRLYMQHVGREGFHNFYRNCQVFASWFARALWPDVQLASRADQAAGKFLWWFYDPKKTFRVGRKKILDLLGYETNEIEDLDIRAKFVPIAELLALNEKDHPQKTHKDN